LNDALKEEMKIDPTIIVLGCDVGVRGGPFGITLDLQKLYGEDRVIDTPISESSFVGAGVGAAATGLRPLVEVLYSDWITLGMDQLVNMAAKMRYMFGGKVHMPLVVRAPFGAGGGIAAQHSQSFEAWFNHVPGLKVVMPAGAGQGGASEGDRAGDTGTRGSSERGCGILMRRGGIARGEFQVRDLKADEKGAN